MKSVSGATESIRSVQQSYPPTVSIHISVHQIDHTIKLILMTKTETALIMFGALV